MTDLSAAIAAAREAVQELDGFKHPELADAYLAHCVGTLRDLLAALDAARGEAVAWVDEFGNAYPLSAYTGKGDWLDDHKRHWRRAYAAPPAAAVPEGYAAALAEVERATRKFPTWPTDPLHALAVLGEEFGELTKAVLQTVYEPHKVEPGELRTEAIQTAAMALRFLASLEAYRFERSEQHEQAAASKENNDAHR